MTSLGDLVLDSGASDLTLYGVDPLLGLPYNAREMKTATGSRLVRMVVSKPLVLEGRTIWRGDAVAISSHMQAGVSGLLPLGIFKTIYACNSEGYVVFE